MGPGAASSAKEQDALAIRDLAGWTITNLHASDVVTQAFVLTATAQDKNSGNGTQGHLLDSL